MTAVEEAIEALERYRVAHGHSESEEGCTTCELLDEDIEQLRTPA